jgi:hypothetical protein
MSPQRPVSSWRCYYLTEHKETIETFYRTEETETEAAAPESKEYTDLFRSVKRFDRFFMFCQVIADDVSERGIAVK